MKSKILKEFDAEVNELRQDRPILGDGPIHKFGYRTSKDGEIFTIPDWGNIKKFLEKALTEWGEWQGYKYYKRAIQDIEAIGIEQVKKDIKQRERNRE